MARRSKQDIEQEASIVQAQLQVLRAREVEFQRVLDDMQRLKDSIASERRELEARQKELHSEIQPINWLPAELLIQIFLSVTAADLDIHDPNEVYHRAPVILSHVSSKWRSIALSTSQIWSKISAQSTIWNSRPLVAFLARSKKAPLDVVFISAPDMTFQEEHRRAERLLNHLTYDSGRIHSIAFQSRGPEAMQKLVGVLTLPHNVFSSLRSLNLSIGSLGPSSLSSPSLHSSQWLQGSASDLNVTYLRLDKLPLFNIPKSFIPNLTTLELSFPPKKSTSEGPNSYMLRMSQLMQFLNFTPQLQELILSNTVPFMDVYQKGRDVLQDLNGLHEVSSVDLVHLRVLEWTYPFGPDIHYFLSFLNIPSLERFDVSVEEFPVVRSHVFLLRGYPDSAASNLFASHRVISLDSLRDLNLQCLHEDTIGSVLRKFVFPAIENLELTHVARTNSDYGQEPHLPTLPRLESIFRDPRLPLLTHLTLCHFAVSPELGKAEALLGYMPALEALTLDTCEGGETLLDGLQQQRARVGTPRVCPRLEAITLWRCGDVSISALLAVVIARNGYVIGRSAGGAGGSGSESGSSAAEAVVETGAGRTIRPMKKLRRLGGGEAALQRVLSSSTSEGGLDIAAAMALGTQPPARISYVRIEGCALISEEDAGMLKVLGVADVVWRNE